MIAFFVYSIIVIACFNTGLALYLLYNHICGMKNI